MRSFPFALLFVSLGLAAHAPSPASGSVREPPLASPRVHPEATTLFAHRTRTGLTFPTFRRNEDFERTGRLPVVVRYLSPPDSAEREKLARRGVTFDRSEPIASGAWLATVTEEGLSTLAANPAVARVSVDMFRSAPPPLERSLEETTANVAKRAAIAKDGSRLDGKGVVIADIDTTMYIHHPSFFRADGGAFAWVDVDGDGELSPGKDGIDLDGSGTIEPSEVLHDLRSTALSRYTNAVIEEHSTFEPDLDYLYLDTNGNGRRDHGKGFAESTPAYGEPLFVFDDANHDKKTQTSERVIQLATSKIKALSSQDKTFERGKSGGKGLIAYAPEDDERLAAGMGHATGVSGILAGGQPGISRWIGLAPEAELLINDSTGRRGPVTSVQWAIDRGADVILTEYAPYTGVSLDGSSEDERILDAAFDKGAIPVSPAGNLATGHKHRTITLEPGSQEITFGTNLPARLAALSLHWRGPERKLDLKLKTPSGDSIVLPESSPDGTLQSDGTWLFVLGQTTPRGTHERFVYIVSQSPMAKGKFALTATLDDGAPVEVDLFVGDDVSDWAGGLSFDEDTPSRTICSPSTSDKTISVAAYVLHDEPDFYPAGPRGAIARYSSQGPRLDGTPGIEIAAPDNPLSAAPPSNGPDSVVWEPFGGTSGAGPHVAAAVALLKQAFPKASASAIKERLLAGARPGPEEETSAGRGRLDLARALDASIASGDPPNVHLEMVGPAVAGAEATMRVGADDDDKAATNALFARWDLDYDGTFDTEWLPLGEQTIPLVDVPVGAKLGVKVEVRDSQGNINGSTATIEVATEPGPAPGSDPASAADACGCRSVGRTAPGERLLMLLGALGVIAFARRARRRKS